MGCEVNELDDGGLDSVHTLDAYMARYGSVLGRQLADRVRPLHLPGRDAPEAVETLRKPLPAQLHVITAGVRHLRRSKSLLVSGACGTGKTLMGMTIAHRHANGKPYRAMVFCPPHLVEKWEREIVQTLPGVKIHQAPKWGTFTRLKDRPDPHPAGEWWIVSQSTAKLGPSWKAAFNTRIVANGERNEGFTYCPHCGEPVLRTDRQTGIQKPIGADELQKRRTDCENCEQPLWTWTDSPRRWPACTYVAKKLHGMFHYLLIDEAHQEKGENTEQGNAAGTLATACRKVIAMTGTLIGGQADHIRSLLYRLDPEPMVERGFAWDDYMPFSEKYGRIEKVVRIKGHGRGADEDCRQGRGTRGRVSKYVRPGIMPALFGDFLIGNTVFLSLEEVAEWLPPLDEQVIPVPMDPELQAEYDRIEGDLTAYIKANAFRGGRRLLGAMLQCLMCYPDRPFGWKEVGHYATGEDGEYWVGVTIPQNLDEKVQREKERKLVELCLAEKAEGRQAWVFTTMTQDRDVCERLQVQLCQAGLITTVLRSSVAPRDREEWIMKNGRIADVIVSHPQLVETGLDLFDKGGNHNFSTLIFYMTGYNLFTLRQAAARSRRIGQTLNCRVKYLYYAGTMQERAMGLMGQKLAASQAIEGKFSSEGLIALAGDEGSMEIALAKSLASGIKVDARASWASVANTPVPCVPKLVLPVAEAEEPPPQQVVDENPWAFRLRREPATISRQMVLFQ